MSEPLDFNGRAYPIEVITPEEQEKKYRFRKVYFQTSDNKVLSDGIQFTKAYRDKKYAQSNLDSRDFHYMWEDKNIPVPVHRVEGFYLVHESLFNTILKPFAKDDPNTNG